MFVSTRGGVEPVPFLEAVATGLAPDGGLFVPENLPDLSGEFSSWEGLPYAELCVRFFSHFATDMDPAELRRTVEESYAGFDDPEVAPLKRLGPGLSALELFHGPTLAFKDFALQWLGRLYERQIARTGRPIAVLGATSGDTGAAAIHGMLGKEGVNIFILYPDGRVSPLQERQMTCTEAANVFPLAIRGTFDDAQTALKDVFGDQSFRGEVGLSAVNSINLARILAQCAYYVFAGLKVPSERRSKTRFVVPTGNFGNVLAGWMAARMGLPCAGFVVATNRNDILHRFFSTGVYEAGDVRPSLAPSMDIQVASNFERFLYYWQGEGSSGLACEVPAKKGRPPGRSVSEMESEGKETCEVSSRIVSWMDGFRSTGRIDLPSPEGAGFASTATGDEEIPALIRSVYDRFGYIVDPHTACGFSWKPHPEEETIVLATAHPAKFPDTIRAAIGVEATHPSLEILKSRKQVKYPLDASADVIRRFVRERTSA